MSILPVMITRLASGLYRSSAVYTKINNKPYFVSAGYVGTSREEVFRMIAVNTYARGMVAQLAQKLAVR